MRFLATILFGLSMILAASGNVQAQARCKDGTAATITGTVGSIEQFRPEPGINIWVLKSDGKFAGNCAVEQVWGNGQAPAACSKGKKFSASGKALDADSFWMLETDKIECK